VRIRLLVMSALAAATMLFGTSPVTATPASAAFHWYAVPRTGGGNPGFVQIRSCTSTSCPIIETVTAPNGAWCWIQTTNCGTLGNGYSVNPSSGWYHCYTGDGGPYDDWLWVAGSDGNLWYMARHCVHAVLE
jgi:hypothetical protein